MQSTAEQGAVRIFLPNTDVFETEDALTAEMKDGRSRADPTESGATHASQYPAQASEGSGGQTTAAAR
jgi:hypothetical protein